MHVPVIPLPIITTSAVDGNGRQYDSIGYCQYGSVGRGIGRDMAISRRYVKVKCLCAWLLIRRRFQAADWDQELGSGPNQGRASDGSPSVRSRISCPSREVLLSIEEILITISYQFALDGKWRCLLELVLLPMKRRPLRTV